MKADHLYTLSTTDTQVLAAVSLTSSSKAQGAGTNASIAKNGGTTQQQLAEGKCQMMPHTE